MPKELQELSNVLRVLRTRAKGKKLNSLVLKIIKLLYLNISVYAREFRDQITAL